MVLPRHDSFSDMWNFSRNLRSSLEDCDGEREAVCTLDILVINWPAEFRFQEIDDN